MGDRLDCLEAPNFEESKEREVIAKLGESLTWPVLETN